MYQFNCLFFGLSSAPRVFTKIMRIVIACLRQLGCQIIMYIDNNLIMASTKELGSSLSSTSISFAARNAGVCGKQNEAYLRTLPGITVPGVLHQLCGHDNPCATTEVAKNEDTNEKHFETPHVFGTGKQPAL